MLNFLFPFPYFSPSLGVVFDFVPARSRTRFLEKSSSFSQIGSFPRGVSVLQFFLEGTPSLSSFLLLHLRLLREATSVKRDPYIICRSSMSYFFLFPSSQSPLPPHPRSQFNLTVNASTFTSAPEYGISIMVSTMRCLPLQQIPSFAPLWFVNKRIELVLNFLHPFFYPFPLSPFSPCFFFLELCNGRQAFLRTPNNHLYSASAPPRVLPSVLSPLTNTRVQSPSDVGR